jgi:hypothetical protein
MRDSEAPPERIWIDRHNKTAWRYNKDAQRRYYMKPVEGLDSVEYVRVTDEAATVAALAEIRDLFPDEYWTVRNETVWNVDGGPWPEVRIFIGIGIGTPCFKGATLEIAMQKVRAYKEQNSDQKNSV